MRLVLVSRSICGWEYVRLLRFEDAESRVHYNRFKKLIRNMTDAERLAFDGWLMQIQRDM